jgi:phage-related minor tail protein
MASRVKGITIELNGETKGLDKALSSVNKESSNLNSELRDVNKLLKLDPGNVELVAQKQQILTKAVQNSEAKLNQLRSAQSQVDAAFAKGDMGEAQYRSFQREVEATEGELKKLSSGLQDTSKFLEGSGDAAASAEAGFKKASKSADDLSQIKFAAVGEAMGGIADKAAEMGGDLIETGMGFADANSLMQSSMGMTADEAENATSIVKEVFKTGMVDSVDEATEAVMTVKNGFADLNNADLSKVTLSLEGIAKHGGVDIKDATNAASQAMKGFGLEGTQATDLVAKGLQDGLNKNDDFLDTVNEYAPTFKDAGIGADGMLAVLNAGMKNGAFNTDKTADAVKEFQLRLTNGDLDKPIQNFSESTQELFAKFKEGGATSADVMAAVGQDLSKMDPTEAKAAVQGLGTQFEDLGTNASAALLQATKGTEDFSGAAKKMGEQTPGEKMQASINKLKAALSEMVAKLSPVIDFITKLVDAFLKAPGPIQTVIGVIGAVMAVLAVLMPIITGIVTVIGAFGAGVLLPIIGIIAGVIAAITAVILVIQNWGAIVGWLQGVWNGIVNFFTTAFNAIVAANIAIWNGIFSTISDIWNGITSFISGVWNGIVSFFSNAFNAVMSVNQAAWNSVASVISGVWNGITGFIGGVVNGISSTISNVFNGIKSVVSGIWNGILSAISDPMTTAMNVVKGAIDAIAGFFNIKISWPKIPMPHFGVKPKGWEIGDLLKGKIPSLDIDWYAKGGVFTKPTLFANNGGYSGVGEAGPEAAIPLNEAVLGGIGAGIARATPGLNAQESQRPNLEINQYFTTTGKVAPAEAQRQAKNLARQMGYEFRGMN